MADAGLPDEVVCVCQAGFTISTYEVNEEFFETSGTFQPLSYWASQGYDVDRIKELTSDKDKCHHEVLGECYRAYADGEVPVPWVSATGPSPMVESYDVDRIKGLTSDRDSVSGLHSQIPFALHPDVHERQSYDVDRIKGLTSDRDSVPRLQSAGVGRSRN